MTAVREKIKTEFGDRYLPAKPIRYAAGKNAQEAHEAIRPTDLSLTPDKIKGHLTPRPVPALPAHLRPVRRQPDGARRLHGDRRRRSPPAPGLFKAQGKVLKFDGHRRVWPPGGKQEDELLPVLTAGQAARPARPRRDPALHPAAAALQRGHADQGPGKGGHRPAQHLRADHPDDPGSRLRRAEGAALLRHRSGHGRDRPPGRALPQDPRPEVHGPHGRRARRHRLGQGRDDQGARRVLLSVPGSAEGRRDADGAGARSRPARSATSAARRWCSSSAGPASSWAARSIPSARRPGRMGGQPRAEAVESEHACPKCGKTLLIRENKRGEKFLSCSGYPECKESFNIDPEGNPVPSVVETEHNCEKCGKPMALRQGSRGAVPGLHGLPQVPQRDAGRRPGQARPAGQGRGPLHEVRRADGRAAAAGAARSSAARTIPSAGAPPRSPTISRTSSPSRPPRPRQPAAPTCKSIPIEETCEQCGGPMLVRRSRRGFFLGCAKYPQVQGNANSPARPRSPRSPRSSGPEPLPSAPRGGGAPARW